MSDTQNPSQSPQQNRAEQALDILSYIRTIKPDWIELWDLLAYITVESEFNPQAYRFEDHLNEASYGLMQLLLSTARQLDYVGPPEGLFDIHTNITLGLKYLEFISGYLEKHLGRPATEEERVEAYNEGIGAVVQGRKDPGYYTKWVVAREYWKNRIIAQNGGIVPSA